MKEQTDVVKAPELDEKALGFLGANRARALKSQNDFESDLMSGVEQSSQLGDSRPAYGDDALANAIESRMKQTSARDLAKLSAQSGLQATDNRSKALTGAFSTDAFKTGDALNRASFALSEDQRIRNQDFARSELTRKDALSKSVNALDARRRSLSEMRNKLQDEIDAENQKRREEAARNAAIRQILGFGGMIGGAVFGGPAGAAAGGAAGNMTGDAIAPKGKPQIGQGE